MSQILCPSEASRSLPHHLALCLHPFLLPGSLVFSSLDPGVGKGWIVNWEKPEDRQLRKVDASSPTMWISLLHLKFVTYDNFQTGTRSFLPNIIPLHACHDNSDTGEILFPGNSDLHHSFYHKAPLPVIRSKKGRRHWRTGQSARSGLRRRGKTVSN